MRDASTWLIVFAGEGDWPGRVGVWVEEATPAHSEAHHLLFTEVEGDRRAVLLVHWSAAERDRVVTRLREHWRYGFVNRVEDLGAGSGGPHPR